MQIIKEKPISSPEESLQFFKDHIFQLGKVKYVVLYYAEREWLRNHSFYHQYVIVIGEFSQLWLSGLSWGYYGDGPHALFELMQIIDSNSAYDQVVSLEWMAEYPIMFEKVNGKLTAKDFDDRVELIIRLKGDRLPWEEGVLI